MNGNDVTVIVEMRNFQISQSALIKSEFCLMSSLRFSDCFATSMAFIEAAAILGFAEEVKIKPGAKLRMKSIISELAAT